ncbi:hypothetical protein L1049_023788 [Liquidambar formosana]|uniref:Uncharacterized protein n=1 Tax=Liquidambar formosana TaxID=63359 RepID=A0AAP0RZL7_LIQFO
MKNVTRNKLLLCFRPVVMEVDLESDGTVADKVFTYLAVENKGGAKISTMESRDCSPVSDETGRRPTGKRGFSRVVKAILFQTSLSKRARDRKVRQDSCGSKSSNLSTESNTNSIAFSSAASSSSSSCPISESNSFRSDCISQKQSVDNQLKKTFMDWSSFNFGLYLLLITLTVTILWGKLCAILFTSMWLYFLPRRHVGKRRSENLMKTPEIHSRDYRKRVIMGGLLERNHHRGH